jgi:hypothetical protein
MRIYTNLDDRRQPLDPASHSADLDAGQPIQATDSAATQNALMALARLLARHAAIEAMRSGSSATATSDPGATR